MFHFETSSPGCANHYVGLPCKKTRCGREHTTKYPNLVDCWLPLVGHVPEEVQHTTATQLSDSRPLSHKPSSVDGRSANLGPVGGSRGQRSHRRWISVDGRTRRQYTRIKASCRHGGSYWSHQGGCTLAPGGRRYFRRGLGY